MCGAELHFQHYTTLWSLVLGECCVGAQTLYASLGFFVFILDFFKTRSITTNHYAKLIIKDREERLQNSFRKSQLVVQSPKDISWMKTENPHSELVTASSRWHLTFLKSIQIVYIQISRLQINLDIYCTAHLCLAAVELQVQTWTASPSVMRTLRPLAWQTSSNLEQGTLLSAVCVRTLNYGGIQNACNMVWSYIIRWYQMCEIYWKLDRTLLSIDGRAKCDFFYLTV